MRSFNSRLARLERIEKQLAAENREKLEGPLPEKRRVIHYGYLKQLPPDYTGPRHVVTVRRIPPEELAPSERGYLWFDWEERPGPGPDQVDQGRADEAVVRVEYVEEPPKSVAEQRFEA